MRVSNVRRTRVFYNFTRMFITEIYFQNCGVCDFFNHALNVVHFYKVM